MNFKISKNYTNITIKYVGSMIRRPMTRDQNRKLRGSLDRFPDFFRMGTFIDSTHMKL